MSSSQNVLGWYEMSWRLPSTALLSTAAQPMNLASGAGASWVMAMLITMMWW